MRIVDVIAGKFWALDSNILAEVTDVNINKPNFRLSYLQFPALTKPLSYASCSVKKLTRFLGDTLS